MKTNRAWHIKWGHLRSVEGVQEWMAKGPCTPIMGLYRGYTGVI